MPGHLLDLPLGSAVGRSLGDEPCSQAVPSKLARVKPSALSHALDDAGNLLSGQAAMDVSLAVNAPKNWTAADVGNVEPGAQRSHRA